MSSQGDHPTKAQSSVPPKPPGHDQMPPWKRVADTSKRFVKRDPQLAPLAFTLGTVGLYLYFHHTKVAEVAKDRDFPRHKETKASGRGSDARVVTGDTPTTKTKGSYYAESGSAPGGIATLLYPHLDKDEREHLENLTVPRNEGTFGSTIKQAAVHDQMNKNRETAERLREREDVDKGRKPRDADDLPLKAWDHLADLHGQKRNY
ncbi:uncharacterized protein SRS1_14107 [Sporisorium reilianum f. sp. reilianum]|uniref:Uncharacterized protein n=1 Tax=Sporisorium reilianum f. sp. reilianum TaxID=72559 RepID=A0A2N8UEU7_9BASI|nr:uncharacterized protein SRS1_14107 [Sporisorium reilianum f. sp. reilianum]